MRAVYKDQAKVSLVARPDPGPPGPGEARIRVAVAGLCRTDAWVAQGRIPSAGSLILGHELAGVVEAVAAPSSPLEPGQRVTVMPLRRAPDRPGWHRASMLGVDRDGAFAEVLRVPADQVYPVARGLDARVAALAEPVAATLAIARAGLDLGRPGLVVGRGRLATLARRVLEHEGAREVHLHDPEDPPPDPDRVAWAVETSGRPAGLSACVRAVEAGGRVVLKSRCRTPAPLDVGAVVCKELTLVGAAYAPMDEALEVMARGLALADLCGEVLDLDEAPALLTGGDLEGDQKVFVAPGGRGVWGP